jgi:hypothetical protein
MGMFDYIRCEYPLPDPEYQDLDYQTKSLDRQLNSYTITEDGRLLWHYVQYEIIPEHQREPPLSPPVFREVEGSREDIEMLFHGTINFYMTYPEDMKDDEYEWVEYQACFTHGKVDWVKRSKPEERWE